MKFKLIILIIILFFLTGCWNYREFNTMAIVGSLGIDYDEEKNEFVISVQILNPNKSTGGESSGNLPESPVIVYKHSAKTIHEALRKITYESPKKLYIGHLESVMFGKTLAENHIDDALDFLFRDSESREDFKMLVVSDTSAYEILKILPPFETTPSANVAGSINANTKFVGSIESITYDSFVSMLFNEGTEAVLPIIQKKIKNSGDGNSVDSLKTSVTSADFIIKEFAVFKNTKMIGLLGEEESIGRNIILGKIKNSVISFECNKEKDSASVEIINMSAKNKINIKDKIPKVSINISGEVTISEVNCAYDFRKQKDIDKIIKLVENKVKELVESSIKKSQNEFNSDIFGFGKYLNKNNFKYWKKNKDKWDEIFPKLKYKVKVKLKAPQKGVTVITFKEKLYDTKK